MVGEIGYSLVYSLLLLIVRQICGKICIDWAFGGKVLPIQMLSCSKIAVTDSLKLTIIVQCTI